MQIKTSIKTFFYFFFLILANGNLFAQNLSIRGQVTESGGGVPVTGATVILAGTAKGTTTDAFGNFNIKGLSQGSYRLVISYLGYEKFEKEISLRENQQIKISLKSSPIHLTEVTVSPYKSITQSESVSGVDKLLRPVSTAQDLLQLVPGLFIAQHAGGGKAEQIFLRGFDCDHGTDFNISVDGMPVNMVSHAHGQGYADFHFVIPETVDRLKVYKGPYTAHFGDFATSGTGEFFTKNSIDRNEVKAELGMFDTYRTLVMFKLLDRQHLFSKEKENAYVAGEYVFTNAYFDNKQKFNRYNLFGKYSGMLNTKNYLAFSASTFFADWDASGQVPERAVEEGIIGRFGSIDPSEGGQTCRTNINSILTTTTNNNAIIKNQLYYVNYYFNLYSDFTFYLKDPVHGDEINQTDQRNIFGYSGSYQKDFLLAGKTLHPSAGIGTRNDFTNISLKHAEKRIALDTIVSGKVYQQNTYSFLDFTLDLNKHFSINAGTRLDYFQFHFTDNTADSLSGTKSIIRASPKLNFYYAANDKLQFFLKSGIGFHSNDARAVVINQVDNSLPKAYGGEVGSEFKLGKRILINAAFWGLYLESELVYVGDEGTVETNNPTQRIGTDLSIRYQITNKLFADVDLNYNHGRLAGAPEGENYIPLAPRLTSIGGLTYRPDKGIHASLRYRFIDSRPANETNSVTAKGYFLLDAVLAYKLSKVEFGLSAENLLNTPWNQAQFDTESRLFNEPAPVSELHYTPGTPFFLKGNIAFRF
ncbi:MAG TPA: TonB-dependent receptor [Bacteroidia bacterium]|nr:TonB-dependent receptor [Bacteroidia bacterium]